MSVTGILMETQFKVSGEVLSWVKGSHRPKFYMSDSLTWVLNLAYRQRSTSWECSRVPAPQPISSWNLKFIWMIKFRIYASVYVDWLVYVEWSRWKSIQWVKATDCHAKELISQADGLNFLYRARLSPASCSKNSDRVMPFLCTQWHHHASDQSPFWKTNTSLETPGNILLEKTKLGCMLVCFNLPFVEHHSDKKKFNVVSRGGLH